MPTNFDLSFTTGSVIEASQVSQFGTPVNNLESGSSLYTVDSGSTNAFVVSPAPAAPSPLNAGYRVSFKASTANTGGATLDVGSGPIPLRKAGSLSLESGDILAGQIVRVVFDGANFQVQGPINIPLAAKGDVLIHNGNGIARLAIGSDNQVLTADSSQAAGVRWAASGAGSASGRITHLWTLCPASAQTINSTTFTDLTLATGSLIVLGGKPLLFHLGVTYEASANQSTRKGFFRLVLGSVGTSYLPNASGFPFVSPYNLAEVASQAHVFYLASLAAGTYTVKLQARMDTFGESAQITTNCNLTCSVVELG